MLKPHGGRLVSRIANEREKQRIEDESDQLTKIEVDNEVSWMISNIANGLFSPLEGFMNQNDYESVIFDKRLEDDLPWTIPIIFNVSEKLASLTEK